MWCLCLVCCRCGVCSNAFWETAVPSQRCWSAEVLRDEAESQTLPHWDFTSHQRVLCMQILLIGEGSWEPHSRGLLGMEGLMNRAWILQPCSWAAFNYTDWFWSPVVRWAASFNSSRTETSERRYGSAVANTTTTLCSSKGRLPQNHRSVNSSGTLMLLFTHSLVTQVITRLAQRRCTAPREPRSRWLVFLVTRETQKVYWAMRTERQCAGNTSACDLRALTCIHKRCRRSCPVTPRLGEGPPFPLLLVE